MEVLIQKKNVILDATVLTTLMACARLVDFRFNHNFHSLDGKSNSLEAGSIVHKVLEVYYRERIKGFSASQAQASGLSAGLMYIQGCRFCVDFEPHDCSSCHGLGIIDNHVTGKIECDYCEGAGKIVKPSCNHEPNEYPGVFNTPAEDEKKPKRIGYKWILETCEQYFDFYKNDHWIPLEVEIVKQKLLYQDDEIRILWKAKLDLVSDTNNGIFPVDHKTMQQNRPTVSLNNQFIGQCIITNTRTVIINKIGFQKSLKPEEKFIRASISYSPDRLLEWQSTILPYWAKTLLMYEESGYFPPRLTNCKNEYGFCAFYKVCEADPDMREEVLKQNFVVGPKWDPINKEEE